MLFSRHLYAIKRSEGLNALVRGRPALSYPAGRNSTDILRLANASSSNKVRKLRTVVVAAFARDSPWTQNRPCERTENRVPFTDFLAKWTIGRLVDSHRPLYIQRREFIGDLLNRTYRNRIARAWTSRETFSRRSWKTPGSSLRQVSSNAPAFTIKRVI